MIVCDPCCTARAVTVEKSSGMATSCRTSTLVSEEEAKWHLLACMFRTNPGPRVHRNSKLWAAHALHFCSTFTLWAWPDLLRYTGFSTERGRSPLRFHYILHHCIIWLGPVLVPVLTPTVWCPLHLGFGDKQLEADRRLPVTHPGNSQMPCGRGGGGGGRACTHPFNIKTRFGFAPPPPPQSDCALLWPFLVASLKEHLHSGLRCVCVFGDRVITQSWCTDERP